MSHNVFPLFVAKYRLGTPNPDVFHFGKFAHM